MNQYAPVGNLEVFKVLDRLSILPHYQLILAHQVAEQPSQWADFYIKRQIRGHIDDVILDNSTVELGRPVHMDDLKTAVTCLHDAGVLHAVVLPDIIRDPNATMEAAERGYDQLKSSVVRLKCMGVVQGREEKDFLNCAEFYMRLCGNDLVSISISRWTVELYGTRDHLLHDVLRVVRPRGSGPTVHLLGFSDNLYDDFRCARHPSVRGIDSAVPIWLGMQGHLIGPQPRLHDFGRRPSWYADWDRTRLPIPAEVISNIMYVQSWLNQPSLIEPNRTK